MFSALPTVDHEQVLRAFVREGAIVQYLKEQATSKRSNNGERRSHRLGVRFADFYYTPPTHQQEGTGTLPPSIGRYFLSSYCGDDSTPRVDTRLLGILGVGLQLNGRRREVKPLSFVPQITEGDMQELEAPLIQTTGRILTILDVVRTILFGKGLLTTSSGSPMGRSHRTFDSYAYPEGCMGSSSAPLSEATIAIRRRLFPGMLPVPIVKENNSNSDSDGDEHVTLGPCDGLVHENDARLRTALESAYNVAKDEFQCSSGGGIRSSAARSYIVRSVAYMRRIRDGSIQGKECADDAEKSGGFLWEVVRTCQECVMQLEDLDKTYMFSSARDEFHECVGDVGIDGPTTENVLVVCGEEVKTSFAFFQDAAHSLYSWAMNCIEMINSYEQQGLLPHASPARRSRTIPDTKTLTSKDDDDSEGDEAVPLSDVSSSYLPLEDRAQSMYEYPLSAVTTQNVPLSEISSALADAIRYPPVLKPDCPLTARLNETCAMYVSGQRLLSVPYFSSIRQLIQTVERETDRLNKLTNDSSTPAARLSPPASRFQFLLDTLRLYYIASVTADEKKTLEHFSSVTMALLSELAAEKSLMEANRNSILTSLQARWDAKKEGRGQGEAEEEEEYYLPDPLLPLYTRDEKDTLNVSFGAFFRTRSAIRGLIGALQKDIMRRNRTHGVVMVTATPTNAASSSSRSGVFSASVVPLVVRHYRASKGKSQPADARSSSRRSAAVKHQIPMENTSVRTVSAMESDENYFQGTDESSSSLFVSPRHFYESGKNFLSRQGSRLPTLKVPLPTSTLAEWKRFVVDAPVIMRRRVEAGCSSSRAEVDDNDGDNSNRGGSTYPVSMVPVRAAVPLDSADLPPTELAPPELAAELDENTNTADTTEGWGFFGAVVGAWQKFSCSLTPNSQEVQDARRMPPPTPDPVFKGPPKSVVSPLVYRKEALLIALIDADNEAQRMHEALSAEYPTLYASGSNFASAERMKAASTRFASAFMPPATAAAVERDGAVVDSIMGATDRIITTIQTRTRAVLDLAEVRKSDEVDPKNGTASQPTLLAHVAKVAQQYSIVFDPPK